MRLLNDAVYQEGSMRLINNMRRTVEFRSEVMSTMESIGGSEKWLSDYDADYGLACVMLFFSMCLCV